jgi:hypothetical protein
MDRQDKYMISKKFKIIWLSQISYLISPKYFLNITHGSVLCLVWWRLGWESPEVVCSMDFGCTGGDNQTLVVKAMSLPFLWSAQTLSLLLS